MVNTKNWIGISALLFSLPIFANDLTITDAWIRATTQGYENGMVGLTITSPNKARIIGATSSAYSSVEMQKTSSLKGKHQVVTLKSISLPAHQTIVFSPDSFHLALLGNNQTLKTGEKVPVHITVKFENNETRDITFMAQPVRIRAGSAPLPMLSPVATAPSETPMVTKEPIIAEAHALDTETTSPITVPAAPAESETIQNVAIPETPVTAEPVLTIEPIAIAEPAPVPTTAEEAPEIKPAGRTDETPPTKVEDCLKYAIAIKTCDQEGGLDEIMDCRMLAESKYGCTPIH
jgi:hypothetical protein